MSSPLPSFWPSSSLPSFWPSSQGPSWDDWFDALPTTGLLHENDGKLAWARMAEAVTREDRAAVKVFTRRLPHPALFGIDQEWLLTEVCRQDKADLVAPIVAAWSPDAVGMHGISRQESLGHCMGAALSEGSIETARTLLPHVKMDAADWELALVVAVKKQNEAMVDFILPHTDLTRQSRALYAASGLPNTSILRKLAPAVQHYQAASHDIIEKLVEHSQQEKIDIMAPWVDFDELAKACLAYHAEGTLPLQPPMVEALAHRWSHEQLARLLEGFGPALLPVIEGMRLAAEQREALEAQFQGAPASGVSRLRV